MPCEVLFVGVAVVLAILVATARRTTRVRGGKILAFMTLFILPVVAVASVTPNTWSAPPAPNFASPAT